MTEPGGSAQPSRRALTLLCALAVALFALWGIGGPLLGTSVLAATDEMTMQGPYSHAGFADVRSTNTGLDDTYTSQLPNIILYKKSLASGDPARWNPYGAGGAPLASVPNGALLSPLTIPYYVLPTWLAPGYEKLLEIICAVGGCVLFLRRLLLSRPAAIIGGLVFASSAFMVVWLNFPQTEVAAFIPAVFWTVERFLQRGRARDAALISLPAAAMLLGGFPAVAGYTFVTVGCYALVRVLAQRPGARHIAGRLLGTAAGLLAGVGLTLFQLLPFTTFYRTWLIEGRGQGPGDHLDPASLVTAVAPWALGSTDPARPPAFVLGLDLPESLSYLGAAALVLVLAALALARLGRAALPRGVWVFLVAVSAVWAELIYVGGPPLALLQRAPGTRELFAGNFIGRSRSMLGFLLAILAAVGFDLLWQRRESLERAGRVWARRLWPAGLALAVLVIAAVVVRAGRGDVIRSGAQQVLDQGQPVANFYHELLIAAVLLAVALAAAAVLHVRRSTGALRLGAAALIPMLIAGQGLYLVTRYYPKSATDTFYPITDTHQYLADNLGEQRFAASAAAMVKGTNSAYELRSVNGHAFINDAFAALIRGLPGDPIAYPTHLDLTANQAQATSPILDRLGTRYFVTSPAEPLFGDVVNATTDGAAVRLSPDQPVTVAATGPLRGVGFTPSAVPEDVAAVNTANWVEAVVHDDSGHELARVQRLTADMKANDDFLVPVPLDTLAADTPLQVTLTLHGPAPVSALGSGGALALSTVVGGSDGLRLVYAGSSVIYQRLDALPRIRWASNAIVDESQDSRIRRLAGGTVDADTVLLSAPGPAAGNGPADVAVDDDGTDEVSATVSANAPGYLVVADADQVGWSATVDEASAPLVAADQGVVAVAVPAGSHTVTLRFAAPTASAGGWLTVTTAALLLAIVTGEWWRERRRGGVRARASARATPTERRGENP